MTVEINKTLKEIYGLYEGKNFQAAYDMAVSLLNETDRKKAILYNVAYCAQSAMGNSERALDLMEEAAEKGHWTNPDQLVEDPDLAPLRENSRFQEITKRFDEASREYSQSLVAKLEVLEPEGFNADRVGEVPVIIALHGNTQSIEDSRENWKFMAKKGWLVALPQSSQAMMEGAFIWNNFQEAIPELKSFYKQLKEKYNIDSKRVVIAGFSMGGALAADLCIRDQIPGGKFILMGPYIRDVSIYADILKDLAKRNGQGYVVVGEKDEECLPASRELVSMCNEHGVKCLLDVIPRIGHEFPEKFPDLVSKAMDKLDW